MRQTVIIIFISLFIAITAFSSERVEMTSVTNTNEGNADELLAKAQELVNNEDFEGALTVLLQANAEYENEGRTNTPEYAKSLHVTGVVYACMGDNANGLKYTKRALELREKLFGKVNEDYIQSLANYAQMLTDYEDAARLQEQVIDLCSKLPTEHSNYGAFTLNMGRYYFIIEKYADAAKYLEIAINYVEKFGEMYEKLLNWLSYCYTETKDQDGISRTIVRVEEHNQHELQKDCDEPKCMKERAEYYRETGDNAKAKEYYLKVLAMQMTDDEKADVYSSYADFLNMNGDYAAGAEYFHLAANAQKSMSGVDEAYIKLIFTAALANYIGKQYDKAIDDSKEVIEYYSNKGGQEALEQIAKCHKNIGNALSGLKKHDEAAEEYQLAIDYYKQYDQQNDEYPKLIVYLAQAEKFSQQYDPAIAHYKEAIAIYKERGMAEEVQNTTNSLNLCYAYSGKSMESDEEAEEDAKKAKNEKLDRIINDELANLELNRTYLGGYTYANSLATIAGSYDLKEDFDNAVKYYRQYIDAIRDAVRDEFRMMSESERMLLWNEQKDNIDELLEILTKITSEKEYLYSDLSATIYDALLLSKGILLNSSIEFEKLLLETGDSHLQDVYKQTLKNEEEIKSMREAHADSEKILSLTRENQALQLELYKGCAEYADFTDYISYKWQDVQDAMSDDDVAVEFTYIDSDVSDDYNYIAAMVMTKTDAPIFVGICNQTTAKMMLKYNDLYVRDEVGGIVWGQMSKYLDGKKRLFFSADGMFNNIGIEYLQYNGKPLSEQMEVYRLSSTKELCRKHDKTYYTNVALFGGINYDGINDLSDEKEQQIRSMSDENRGSAMVNAFPYLQNSLHEVQEIEQICKDGNIPGVLLFTATEASETAFRKLDNSKINLFHIATHGTYKEDDKSTEADAMSNCTLAFAGANVGGDNTVDNDGIVSAADVAKMNLRHCDLAVLSACETGLGKLGDDGVFGLQRGFKNAGIHSLLMTLKSVSDVATTDLMVSFYRYLMNGKSKREALSLAQQDLRAKGFTDANYWATFILLDGIN